MLKYSCHAILLALLASCSRQRMPVIHAPQVNVWGSLRAIMHEGEADSRVSLGEAAGVNVYGVGALSGLRGEIILVDGVTFTSQPGSGGIEVRQTTVDHATLLVTAAVPAWKSVRLTADVGADELDDQIEALARANGIDVEKAFPVLIDEGMVDVQWHVLDGSKLAPGGNHADHLRGAVTGSLATKKAILVGFFSKHHQGAFTHMGERTHFHVLTADHTVMGHVDRLAVRAGATLKLPARADQASPPELER